MTQQRKSHPFGRVIGTAFSVLDGTRRVVLNAIFLFLLILILAVLLSSDVPEVDAHSALVLDPHGDVVEQYTTEPLDRAFGKMLGQAPQETLLRDLLRAIEHAAGDPRIDTLVLSPAHLRHVGLSQLRELRSAVEAFKRSGKKVVALADNLTQHQYYFVTLADEILMHPDGALLLTGYGRYRTYYKGLMDKLAVNVHLFRVGEYKSAGESFVRRSMSDYAKEANLAWLGDLWGRFKRDVAAARGLDVDAVGAFVEELDERVAAAGGEIANAARDAGLIDRLASRDAMRDHVISLTAKDPDTQSFRQIALKDYLKVVEAERSRDSAAGEIAVVVAQGTIVGGEQPRGTIGGESTARLIRQARNDRDVRAIVLRIDSPGGSMFPSEIIRREIEVTRAAGKPVVVSMGDVAASGGYYIGMSADEIWASPTTITGSIGVYGLLLNFPETMDKIGLNTDGVGTTRWAGAARPDRKLDPAVADLIQGLVDNAYEDFITRVADARDMSVGAVDAVARGRVWSGRAAQEHGLVDRLGGLSDAIAATAERAELGEDYRVRYVERKLSAFERFVVGFARNALAPLDIELPAGLGGLGAVGELARLTGGAEMLRDLRLIAEPATGLGSSTHAYCFCRPPR